MTQIPSKQLLMEHFIWNRDKFNKMMRLAGVYAERPEILNKKNLSPEEFKFCKKRLKQRCFVVIK